MTDTRLTEDKERLPCLGHQSNGATKMVQVRRLVALDVLMVVWGLGTWLGVNGLFVQLPLLVDRLPERWALPTYMALAVQAGNAGLLLYWAARRLLPSAPDAHYIYGLLAVGTLALALNAVLHQETVTLGGREMSLPFLALTVGAALVGCTSSVLFYPYLRHYRDVYLVTYLVGEGLSGLLPSMLALVQGVGGEPHCVLLPGDGNDTFPELQPVYPPARFSTTVFLLVLSALSALSLVSFAAVDRCGVFRSQRVQLAAAAKAQEAACPGVRLRSARWTAALTLMCTLNALTNGVMPSIQSYSCMPYGTRAYHLAAALSALAAPAACLPGIWLRPMPAPHLCAALLGALPALAYMLATALLSPAPPLQHHPAGVALIVCAWVWVAAVLSYARMWVFAWARAGGARGMRAAGAATQLGSAAGALLLCALVRYTRLFTQGEVCAQQL